MLFFMLLWIIENDVIFISGMGLVSIPFVMLVMLLEIDAIIFGVKYWIDFKKGKRRSPTRTWKW